MDVKWQNKDGEWHPFDISDIIHREQAHALHLFSNSTPVVIKCDDGSYVVNTSKLLSAYRQQKKEVISVMELLDLSVVLDKPLAEVGFSFK